MEVDFYQSKCSIGIIGNSLFNTIIRPIDYSVRGSYSGDYLVYIKTNDNVINLFFIDYI